MTNLPTDFENLDPLAQCAQRWKAFSQACQAHEEELDAAVKEILALRQAEMSRHQLRVNQIDEQYQKSLSQCDHAYQQQSNATESAAALDLKNIKDHARVEAEEIQNKFKDDLHANKQHLEEAIWLAESVLETGEAAPKLEFEETHSRLVHFQATLNQSIAAAVFQLKRYRQSEPPAPPMNANLVPKSCEGILATQAAIAMDALERFRKLKLPGLFRGPILLVPSILITGTFALATALAGGRGMVLAVSAAVGVFVSGVGICVLWFMARKQVRHSWIAIANARQVGAAAFEMAMKLAQKQA